MYAPFRLIARIPNRSTNLFYGILDILQNSRSIVGNGELIGVLLGFLGKENALLLVKNQVVDYFFFGLVDMFGTAEHKFGDERDREQFFNLQFSPIGTRNLWSGHASIIASSGCEGKNGNRWGLRNVLPRKEIQPNPPHGPNQTPRKSESKHGANRSQEIESHRFGAGVG